LRLAKDYLQDGFVAENSLFGGRKVSKECVGKLKEKE